MVYALGKLDCSHKLTELIDILFEINSYEVQYHILRILDNQIFEFNKQDFKKIEVKWNKIKNTWNELNKIDKENLKKYNIDDDLIQSFVERYVSYLKKD